MHLVIFDIDGTLTQTYHSKDHSFTRALSRFVDIEPGYSYWGEIEHPTDEAVFQYLFQKVSGKKATEEDRAKMQDQLIVELMHTYRHTPNFFDEIPGASRFIKELKEEENTLLAISTGNWERVGRMKVELAGLNPNDFEWVGSDEFPDKPGFTTSLINRIKEKQELSRITYIGDSLYDYETSRVLGINFIGIDFLQKGHMNHLTFCPIYADFREIQFL